MKLSEIFRKVVSGGNSSPDSEPDGPQREDSVELPPFVDKPDEEIANNGGEETPEEIIPFQPPRVPLPENYVYPDAAEAANAHADLLRELSSKHPLFGVPLEAFAACQANDDTLFRYRGNPTRFVLVHLTWSRHAEIDANYPIIAFIGTFEEFLQREKELYGLEPPA